MMNFLEAPLSIRSNKPVIGLAERVAMQPNKTNKDMSFFMVLKESVILNEVKDLYANTLMFTDSSLRSE